MFKGWGHDRDFPHDIDSRSPVVSKPTTEVSRIFSGKILWEPLLENFLWVTQSKLELTAKYSILDANSYEIHLVLVPNIILHHHKGKFKPK